MPSKSGSQGNWAIDRALHKELQTLLAAWPLPTQQMSGVSLFLRSFMIAELEDLAELGGREPSHPLRMLTDALKGLQIGHDHPIFKPARASHESRGRGRPPASAQKTAALRFSVRYLLSAEQGIIEDRSPKQTIGEAFGVDLGTVTRWSKKHRADIEPLSTIPVELAAPLLRLAGNVYISTLKKLNDWELH